MGNEKIDAYSRDAEHGRPGDPLDGELWAEYDSAADWCAARGLDGWIGCKLPEGLSAKCGTAIQYDPEAFQSRVRAFKYARAMNGIKAEGGAA